MATMVAMYKPVRTRDRPPPVIRFPRNVGFLRALAPIAVSLIADVRQHYIACDLLVTADLVDPLLRKGNWIPASAGMTP